LANSKPTSVYTEYSYNGIQRVANEMRESTIYKTLNGMKLQEIETDKEASTRNQFLKLLPIGLQHKNKIT